MAGLIRFVLLLLCIGMAAPAAADNFSPAFLQLTERNATTYDVRWKTPARDEQTVLPVQPVFPGGTRFVEPLVSTYAGGTAVMIGRIAVPGGLAGKEIKFEGLTQSRGEVLVSASPAGRQRRADKGHA